MNSTWEAELYPKVGPDSHDQDALTSLWNAEVGGVKTLIHYVVPQPGVIAARIDSLESGEVIGPSLSISLRDIRKTKLVNDVVVIVCETRSKQPL